MLHPHIEGGSNGRMAAKGVFKQDDTMRIVTHHLLPLLAAASTSTLLLGAAII
ncbi:MAG TPA: hypothetical protein VLA37_07560 [Sphingomonadaceae bacterium]|nr:hypothetical protein [Sphingomonadaceae bacterium]